MSIQTPIKTLYTLYDKEKLNNLPVVEFAGRIVVIFTEAEARKAVDYLLAQPVLGIDTETRPAFRRGQHHQVSLLQVATQEVCFLFRLNLMGMTPSILRLLSDSTVPKIGLSLKDDLQQLQRREAFEVGYFVDLQHLVPQALGVKDLSLQKLFANFFGLKISKSQRLSNWDSDVLQPKQQQYAAIDAWACVLLYKEVLRLQQTKQYHLIEVPTPAPPAPREEQATKKPKRPRKPRTKPSAGAIAKPKKRVAKPRTTAK